MTHSCAPFRFSSRPRSAIARAARRRARRRQASPRRPRRSPRPEPGHSRRASAAFGDSPGPMPALASVLAPLATRNRMRRRRVGDPGVPVAGCFGRGRGSSSSFLLLVPSAFGSLRICPPPPATISPHRRMNEEMGGALARGHTHILGELRRGRGLPHRLEICVGIYLELGETTCDRRPRRGKSDAIGPSRSMPVE